MRVLSSGKYDDVISWTPDGKAFVVHNQNELVKQVLPLNDFKGVKYSSFTRKVRYQMHYVLFKVGNFLTRSVNTS